ncbi:MAG: CoB--CoM heterodisulfide reductase iron-sulfur subunit B family protein [Deltaproteobacteria bacterium]|nr:CoB--CoM heterodisulfide reductase iron-sulfur subunit B family protein [Deltaproteobacteria bacterium]
MIDQTAKRIAYYPGCSVTGTAVEFDQSTRALCAALGVELIEIPDWNCCGSTPAHSYDPLLGAALAGRNLAMAEEMGLDVVMTPCPSCLKALKEALRKYEEKQHSFLDILQMPFSGQIRAISVLQLLYEDISPKTIREQIRYRLTNTVIVPYYGCLLSRPPEFARFDDPVPEFPFKTECCGAAYGVTQNHIVGKMTGRILDMARRLGAAAVAVACPLCQQNLDLRQSQVNRFWHTTFQMPVVYITQILGFALGIDPKKLGLDKLFVSADDLFLETSEPLENPTESKSV